jgi:predicted flavoprotein YhiN
LAARIKGIPLRVSGLASLDRAISTAGGVAWQSVDEALMLKSRPGVFLAGEMLDWEAPTGGYLLQATFATAARAAAGLLNWLGPAR